MQRILRYWLRGDNSGSKYFTSLAEIRTTQKVLDICRSKQADSTMFNKGGCVTIGLIDFGQGSDP